MVLMEFSITPMDKGESVSQYVARCVDIIDRSGLEYELHSMGTIVEGELEAVLAVFKSCMDRLAEDCDRITCTAKIDYRKAQSGRLKSMVNGVEQILGRNLK